MHTPKYSQNNLKHCYAKCLYACFLMLVAKVEVVISDGMLQLYFIKYNLAGITELLLVLRGSDI